VKKWFEIFLSSLRRYFARADMDKGKEMPFRYVVLEDGTAEITKYTGNAENVVIPSSLDARKVTSLGKSVFIGSDFIKSITLPDSVTTIGEGAFYGCSSLTDITIPDSVTTIGEIAFCRCKSLTSVTIPDSVKTMGAKHFVHCSSLVSINVSPEHSALAVVGGVLFDKAMKTLICYPAGLSAETYTIPQGIVAIGEYAFYMCGSLWRITVPDSVSSIGAGAFRGYMGRMVSVDRGSYAEQYAKANGITYVYPDEPNGSHRARNNNAMKKEESTAAKAKTKAKSEKFTCGEYMYVVLEDGTAEIGKYTGRSINVTIPSKLDRYTVTSLGNYAFGWCESLASVTIPNSVTTIGDSAFDGCKSLTSVTLPNSVTTIGDSAFCRCDSLTNVTIPDSVTTMGKNPFEDCSSLVSINVSQEHSALAVIDGVLFDKAMKKLICYPVGLSAETYTIPQGVVVIDEGVFSFCDSLTSITIPDSVTRIGSSAFLHCESLTSVTIPDSVTSIGAGAFFACKGLRLTVGHGSFAEFYANDSYNEIPFTFPDGLYW
jgi:hypothetical protein